MEYLNLLNFCFCILFIISLILFIPLVNSVITAFAVTFFVVKLAEELMKMTRKHLMYRKVSPKNKVVMITGCDMGFGNALARRMDKLGYSVLATCLDADGEGPKKLSHDCSDRLTVLTMDITNEQSIEKVKIYIEKYLERKVLWALVNNAGIMKCGHFEWSSVEEFQHACDVNTFGALRVTKAFLPFIKRSKGRIVTITSCAGRYMIPGFSAYCLSKSASVALSTAFQMELVKWGIKCISIEPFLFATSLVAKQSLFTMARKTWDAAPKNVKEEYDESSFRRFKTRVDRILSIFALTDISKVIDSLEDAITAEDPLPVYIPANLVHRILVFIYANIPLGMKEQFAGYGFGFN